MTSPADQTERVILHVGLGTPFPCACNNEKQHVKYVPAAAFDAAREEIRGLTTRREAVWVCTDCGKDQRVLVPLVYQQRAERAEAELAKAKAEIEEMRALFDPDRKPFVVMDQDEYDKWTEWRKRTESELAKAKKLLEQAHNDFLAPCDKAGLGTCEIRQFLDEKANP